MVRLGGTSSASQQVDDKNHECHHQEQVDQTSSYVETDPQEPKNQKNAHNRPRYSHLEISFVKLEFDEPSVIWTLRTAHQALVVENGEKSGTFTDLSACSAPLHSHRSTYRKYLMWVRKGSVYSSSRRVGDSAEPKHIGRIGVNFLAASKNLPNSSSLLTLIVVVIAALYFGRAIFIPIALAVVLTFLLTPAVTWLERCRLGRIPSVFLSWRSRFC